VDGVRTNSLETTRDGHCGFECMSRLDGTTRVVVAFATAAEVEELVAALFLRREEKILQATIVPSVWLVGCRLISVGWT